MAAAVPGAAASAGACSCASPPPLLARLRRVAAYSAATQRQQHSKVGQPLNVETKKRKVHTLYPKTLAATLYKVHTLTLKPWLPHYTRSTPTP